MKKKKRRFDLLGHSFLSLSILSLKKRKNIVEVLIFIYVSRERKLRRKEKLIALVWGVLRERKIERSQVRNLHTNKRASNNSDMKFVNIRSLFYSLLFLSHFFYFLKYNIFLSLTWVFEELYIKEIAISRFSQPSLLLLVQIFNKNNINPLIY